MSISSHLTAARVLLFESSALDCKLAIPSVLKRRSHIWLTVHGQSQFLLSCVLARCTCYICSSRYSCHSLSLAYILLTDAAMVMLDMIPVHIQPNAQDDPLQRMVTITAPTAAAVEKAVQEVMRIVHAGDAPMTIQVRACINSYCLHHKHTVTALLVTRLD